MANKNQAPLKCGPIQLVWIEDYSYKVELNGWTLSVWLEESGAYAWKFEDDAGQMGTRTGTSKYGARCIQTAQEAADEMADLLSHITNGPGGFA